MYNRNWLFYAKHFLFLFCSHDEAKIRKAYFRLAQKYHPDKNPEGRDMFEKVNKAYEFLCSKSKITEGPDPKNVVLILKAQSILFSRHKEGEFSVS